MTEQSKPFIQKVYILRCWQDTSEGTWHFALESAKERVIFTSLAEFVAFLQITFPDAAIPDQSIFEE